jgi:hypothetical protein
LTTLSVAQLYSRLIRSIFNNIRMSVCTGALHRILKSDEFWLCESIRGKSYNTVIMPLTNKESDYTYFDKINNKYVGCDILAAVTKQYGLLSCNIV